MQSLVVLIDAADNAEMAAKEYCEFCFVNQLLREEIPEGCRIVALCRTERLGLLRPSSAVRQIELMPFSESETLDHLRNYYPQSNYHDGLELHRLTSGNPRVQANALSMESHTIAGVLTSLGPSGTAVDDQIAMQLKSAITKVKECIFPLDFQGNFRYNLYRLGNSATVNPDQCTCNHCRS